MTESLTVYWGLLLNDVLPLEMSLNWCSHSCHYCFANLNSPSRTANVPQIQGLLANYKEKHSFSAFLLREGYPIKCSNHVDFFAKSNEELAMPIMEAMTELGIPFSLATKGGDRFDEALKFLKPSTMYFSLATLDESVLRRTEEGAPPAKERLRMMENAKSRGHRLTVGINPCVSEWLTDPLKMCKQLKAVGVEGVWVQPLHLNTNQLRNMPDRGKAALGEAVISVGRRRRKSQENIDIYLRTREAAKECGLAVYDMGQTERSDYFKPYQETYKKTYPIMQDFVNHCYDVGKVPHVTPIYWTEFRDFFVSKFPQGVFPLRNHIGAAQYRHFWKDWDSKIPKDLSYEKLLQFCWEIREVAYSPSNVRCFGRAVVTDGSGEAREVLDSNGMPILLFTPDAAPHENDAYAEWLEPDSSLPFEFVTPVVYDEIRQAR